MKKRIVTFDVLKCFAIFLVIWGHCIGSLANVGDGSDLVYRIIYSFHMPLFMMMSGYFATSSMESAPCAFFKKKFMQLIFPCIIWGALCWVFLESIHSFHYGNPEFSVIGLFSDFYWLSDFWFLKSCFICYCLAYIGSHIGLKRPYWMILTLVISQLIIPFFVSFMFPCFIVGMELKCNKALFAKVLKFRYWIFALFLLMLLFWNEKVWNGSHGIPEGILQDHYTVWVKIVGFRLYRLFLGIVGALGIIAVFTKALNREELENKKLFRIVSNWGRYTLEVYILQAIILERTLSHFISFSGVNWVLFDLTIAPVLSFVILSLCIFIAKILKKDLKKPNNRCLV